MGVGGIGLGELDILGNMGNLGSLSRGGEAPLQIPRDFKKGTGNPGILTHGCNEFVLGLGGWGGGILRVALHGRG